VPATAAARGAFRVGLVSDTHGLLRPQAIAFLRGSDRILHAGDIGGPDILASLATLAPVAAVRGNNDTGSWAAAIPLEQRLAIEGVVVHVLHDLKALTFDPVGEGVRVVVAGHSHRPSQQERDGVLYVNPGSAGPRRFRLPVSVGELLIEDGSVRARLHALDVSDAEQRS